MHHLQIMEALGGDALWIDRFLAQHGAILYYWVLVAFYLLFPNLAYNFSELVESHASDTYAVFVDVRPSPDPQQLKSCSFQHVCHRCLSDAASLVTAAASLPEAVLSCVALLWHFCQQPRRTTTLMQGSCLGCRPTRIC